MYEASIKTFSNRRGFFEPLIERGGFSGPIYIRELKDAYILKCSDGVGTKVRVASQMDKHDTIAYDLLAMVCDDAACMGAEPFAVTNTLNVKKLELDLINSLASGLVKAAKSAKVAVVGGEIAELGDLLNQEYIWDADCIAVIERDKLKMKKEEPKPGDKIIALRSRGFRCNGFSLVRRILKRLGKDWVKKPYDSRTWGEVVLTPSLIYTPLLVEAFGGYGEKPKVKIKKAAHITGGGIPANLRRILPEGLGAYIDIKPHEEMLALQELGKVEDREAYRVWNMGVGMLLVTNDKIFELAKKYGIEAVKAGEVISEPVIRIKNRGFFGKEKELVYDR
jgi:phosphoribosylformylglycinamidine cyclo-ligase